MMNSLVSFVLRYGKSILLFFILATVSSLVYAESSVTEVSCQQMWPFDRSVIINYTIESDTDSFLSIKFYGDFDNKGLSVDLSRYGLILKSGADGTVPGAGKYKTIWVPGDNYYGNLVCDMKIMVDIKEISLLPKSTYMVLDFYDNSVAYLDDVPKEYGWWDYDYKSEKMVLRKIIPQNFIMGSPADEIGRYSDELQHEVVLTKPYYIGVFEVTQGQYSNITGNNPSQFNNNDEERPVENVSYEMIRGSDWPSDSQVAANSFLGKLRSKFEFDFDLPTEAQWEYACRAGTTTALNDGSNLTNKYEDGNLNKLGRYRFNCKNNIFSNEHTIVGYYSPNAWGLYDMHGNVWEWCLDWWDEDENWSSDPVTDPVGAEAGVRRVIRGGSWNNDARNCRSAGRNCESPKATQNNIGFRVALTMEEQSFIYVLKPKFYGNPSIFTTKFYAEMENGNECLLEDIANISGEGATGIVLGYGVHELLWTPKKGYENLIGKLKLRVEYEDVTKDAKYLVLDLNTYKMRNTNVGPREDAEILAGDICKTRELWLRRIEAGNFMMGSPTNEFGRSTDETNHQVTFTKGYYIGVFETTQYQYEKVVGFNPSSFKGNKRPAEQISYQMLRGHNYGSNWPKGHLIDETSLYYDNDRNQITCPTFFYALRMKTGNCLVFDLPTEAQWEFACRAGTNSALNNGYDLTDSNEDSNMNKLGRYEYNCGKDQSTATVGSYLPNAWGLYDMHGNVYEWCLDYYDDSLSQYPEIDPVGPSGGRRIKTRVLRGGAWSVEAASCRSAYRNKNNYPYDTDNGIGFRIVLLP